MTIDEYCCPKPSRIAIISLCNEYEIPLVWKIELSENQVGAYVIAEQVAGMLQPGGCTEIGVWATVCPQETRYVGVTVLYTRGDYGWEPEMTSNPDWPLYLKETQKCDPESTYDVTAAIPCPARERVHFTIGDLVSGMSLLELLQLVPEDLYGSSNERLAIAGSQTYCLLDITAGTAELLSVGSAAHFGAVPLVAPVDSQMDTLIAFGPAGLEILRFDDEAGAFSEFAQIDPPNSTAVFDVVPFADDPLAAGVVVARPEQVQSRVYDDDPTSSILVDGQIAVSAAALTDGGAIGNVVSAFAYSATGPVLIVTEGVPDTSPGQVFFWTADNADTATLIGATGDTPRRVRGVQIGGTWVLAVSNFGGSSLTLLTGTGDAQPTIAGTVDLAGQPIGIDAAETSSGAAAFVATGFDTDTFSVVTVATDGSVVDNTSTALDPNEVDAPGHAIWLDDGSIAISGNASNTVLIEPDVLP